jgi:hypothetical protein
MSNRTGKLELEGGTGSTHLPKSRMNSKWQTAVVLTIRAGIIPTKSI